MLFSSSVYNSYKHFIIIIILSLTAFLFYMFIIN